MKQKDLEKILKFDTNPFAHSIEICLNCKSYGGCVNAILRYPEWQVKCIHFGFLTNEILKEKNDDIPK